MVTVIKSGTIITAEATFKADILVDGEKISTIGMDLEQPGAEIVVRGVSARAEPAHAPPRRPR